MATQYCSGWWSGCWGQSGYGFGSADTDYPTGKHPGIDLGLAFGTPIYAAEEATVVWAGWMTGTGNTIVLALKDGTQVLFGHLSHLNVKRGDQPGAGMLIGSTGNSGNATGNHLHFEVRSPQTGLPIDPVAWLHDHLDTRGVAGTGIGAQATGNPASTDQGFLGIPGAITDFGATLTKDLARAGWLIAGLLLFVLGLALVVVPEFLKRAPLPAKAPLQVLKGGEETAA